MSKGVPGREMEPGVIVEGSKLAGAPAGYKIDKVQFCASIEIVIVVIRPKS